MERDKDRVKEPEVADARRRIAQASFRLFGERGYSCTSIQDIADAAGVRKAMVYYYFSSKEGLYQALVNESSAGMRDMLTQVLLGDDGTERPEQSAVAQLEAVAELVLGLARDNRDSVRFFLSHMFAADADRPACSFEESAHTPPNVIQQIAQRGVRRGELRGDAGDLARLLVGAIQVSAIRYVRTPEQEPLPSGLGRRLVRALLRGFGPERATERATETAPQKRNDRGSRNGHARARKSAPPSASTPSKSSRNHRA